MFPVADMFALYRKRLGRIIMPFTVWCTVYALYQFSIGQIDARGILVSIAKIPINFGTDVGHLWYIHALGALPHSTYHQPLDHGGS